MLTYSDLSTLRDDLLSTLKRLRAALQATKDAADAALAVRAADPLT